MYSILYKHFNSISTRIKCFFKNILANCKPRLPKTITLIIFCLNFYGVTSFTMWMEQSDIKYIIYEHKCRCSEKTDSKLMPTSMPDIDRNRLNDTLREREREKNTHQTKVTLNSMNFYWTWNSINHTSQILWAQKEIKILIAIIQPWSILLCIRPSRFDWKLLMYPVENTLSNLYIYELCNDLINKSFYIYFMLLTQKKSDSILKRRRRKNSYTQAEKRG